MQKHISFPSIEQFRSVVTAINRHHNFVGLDANGEAIYDHTLPKPTLTFIGTTKLNGTNSGVCFNAVDGMWVQSRENIITPQKDNAGFAAFAESTAKAAFLSLFDRIAKDKAIDLETNTITIYGEWVGQGIQKGVAITNLPKSLFIFAIKVSPFPTEENPTPTAYWVDHSGYAAPDVRIHNIMEYPTYSMKIDFNMPQLVQNDLAALTEQVEAECPVAKAFGFSGVGEGIVWSVEYNGAVHRFKVKGEKHSASKVKTLASVDVEKLNSVVEFVEYAATESRLRQAIENVFGSEGLDIKRMGDVIRWVVADITKEELDVMSKNGLEPKDVNKHISAKVRTQFFLLMEADLVRA